MLSFLSEFWQFLRCNKKWWLGPLVLFLLLMGLQIDSGPAKPIKIPVAFQEIIIKIGVKNIPNRFNFPFQMFSGLR